jgi:hypothetical protein
MPYLTNSGTGLRKLGQRGVPFELVSVQFHATFAAARAAMQSYDDAPGTAAVALVRNGENHGNFFVLRVVERITQAVFNPTGNANPAHTVRQEVVWTLHVS